MVRLQRTMVAQESEILNRKKWPSIKSHKRSFSNVSNTSINYDMDLKESVNLDKSNDTNKTPPAWVHGNRYFNIGHRPQLSIGGCFKSIFQIHNETGNIWSHLIGCIGFIIVGLFYMTRSDKDFDFERKVVFAPFFIGVTLCFGFSTLYHVLSCHSKETYDVWHKLDHTGISILISASFIQWVYFIFYCQFFEKCLYITLSLTFGLACSIVFISNTFLSANYKPLRATVFVLFGLCGLVPVIHHYFITGNFWNFDGFPLGWMLLMAILYIIGAVFYGFRFPEKYFPKKFDLVFQSHQIFHVFVIVAAIVHLYGTIKLADMRISHICN